MKKSVLLGGVLLMLLSPIVFVSANDGGNTTEQELQNKKIEDEKQEVIQLLDELAQYKADSLLDENDLVKTYSLDDDSYVLELENKLLNLGVTEVSEDELLDLNLKSNLEDGMISPLVSVPSTTNAVKWYSKRYTYTYNGVSYNIQELYAQGNNGNSPLIDGGDGKKIYTNKQIAVSNLKNLASIYAQKAIGLISIVQWTPYELLFSNNSKVVNNSHTVTYRSVGTVCFTYVRKSTQTDSYQQLSFVSNRVSLASTHVLAGVNNGTPYTQTKSFNHTFSASTYAPLEAAVKSFLNVHSQRSSYVSNYKFYNHDKSASLTQYVATPSYPAQVK